MKHSIRLYSYATIFGSTATVAATTQNIPATIGALGTGITTIEVGSKILDALRKKAERAIEIQRKFLCAPPFSAVELSSRRTSKAPGNIRICLLNEIEIAGMLKKEFCGGVIAKHKKSFCEPARIGSIKCIKTGRLYGVLAIRWNRVSETLDSVKGLIVLQPNIPPGTIDAIKAIATDLAGCTSDDLIIEIARTAPD